MMYTCRTTPFNQTQEYRTAVARFPLVAWLRQFGPPNDKGGENIQINCPVCKGRLKLGIHRARKVAQCFKCSEGGAGGGRWNGKTDLIGLIRLFEGCNYSRAVHILFNQAGLPEPKWERATSPDRSFPKEAIPLAETPVAHASRQFLIRRGVDHLAAISHVCVTGDYEGRIILPSNWFGTIEGWEAKSYCGGKPKSLFPEWFETANCMYSTAWDSKADFAILTESIFDAETFGVNAIGLFGSNLRDGQFEKLLTLRDRGVRRLVWALDYDAWKKQATCIIRRTETYFENLVVELPRWSDPNELGREMCWSKVAAAKRVRDSLDLVILGLDR